MHNIGTALLVICILAALVGTYESTLLLDIRHKWLTEIEQRQKKIADGAVQIADARRRVRDLEEQRQRLTHAWGDVWQAPNARPQPGGAGVIDLDAGSNAGFPQKQGENPPPSVYLFADNSGQTNFIGEFAVTASRGDASVVQLTRPPYPQEVAKWPQGGYHARNQLPQDWLTMMAGLQAEQIVAESNLQAQMLQLQILNNQIKASQEALDQRLAELNGNPNAPPGASEDVMIGLVATIRKSEVERNTVLANVDRLRRELVATYDSMRYTLDQNRTKTEEMERGLQNRSQDNPQPGSAVGLKDAPAGTLE